MMAAAARLFADRGYVRTTMVEIAKRAEFALGTIYQSFRTKEDVYFSILNEKSDELIAILDRLFHPFHVLALRLHQTFEILPARYHHTARSALEVSMEAAVECHEPGGNSIKSTYAYISIFK